ncbi:MAG: RcnB family protein [Azonexaceae bacterium]|uniref:RcnB family protein n=1 Tax=Azonexus sp. R2A61 TaxID=2744443 RepID=UPI001F2E8FC6|nr:RcnB family protein [Azonexus sp. R2A61]MCE1240123.1 RcnB family protein [Azonexaceae bacterium]
MIRHRPMTLIAALLLSLSAGLAHADPHDRHGRHDRQDGHRYQPQHSPQHYDRHHQTRGYDRHHRGPGIGPHRHYHRGDRLAHAYRSPHYVVADWHRHHLYAPPRGQQWVQVGPDYALIAIGTGIIAQIVIGR